MLNEFSCEEKLMKLNPSLYKRYFDSLYTTIKILTDYRAIFPDYIDHSYLHTINVLEYCNRLIGGNIERMNCGEIYTLMMGAALHDSGIGVSTRDFHEFMKEPTLAAYSAKHPEASKGTMIRGLHHELSGCFIRKYSKMLEIPDEFVYPIIQVVRGHNNADLNNEIEYPTEYSAGKYIISIPYLTSLIRLADKLDITAERNVQFDNSTNDTRKSYKISTWRLHFAIKDIIITEKKCIILAEKSALSIEDADELSRWLQKLRKTFAYCSNVIEQRSDFLMVRRKVILEYL